MKGFNTSVKTTKNPIDTATEKSRDQLSIRCIKENKISGRFDF